jgi:hypothetical protein
MIKKLDPKFDQIDMHIRWEGFGWIDFNQWNCLPLLFWSQ